MKVKFDELEKLDDLPDREKIKKRPKQRAILKEQDFSDKDSYKQKKGRD